MGIKRIVNVINKSILETLLEIKPIDALEGAHLEDALSWARSSMPLFRVKKPDIPPKHIVSYCVLVDQISQKILLVDHKKAGLWLPTGGHVEVGENPKETAWRECKEELGIAADFLCEAPLFLTVTKTVGENVHTDVTLWYVFQGSVQTPYEFHQIKWFSFDEIPYETSDPHMKRFILKLKEAIKNR